MLPDALLIRTEDGDPEWGITAVLAANGILAAGVLPGAFGFADVVMTYWPGNWPHCHG